MKKADKGSHPQQHQRQPLGEHSFGKPSSQSLSGGTNSSRESAPLSSNIKAQGSAAANSSSTDKNSSQGSSGTATVAAAATAAP